LTKEEIEAAGFKFRKLEDAMLQYNVETLRNGWNSDSDGEFYYVSNPALGLWADKNHFSGSD